MNLLSFFHRKSGKDAQRCEMARRLHGRTLKYVIERRDNSDTVIARESAIVVRDGTLVIYAGAETLFRCPVAELQISELMSLEGAMLTGCDEAHGGEERTVIAYYTYYRKDTKN